MSYLPLPPLGQSTGANSLPVVINSDRSDRNTEVTILASAARTASTQSSDITNENGLAAIIALSVTALSSTPSITLRILWKDPISGVYGFLNATPTAVTATGLYLYQLGPGCVSSGGSIVQTTAAVLPRTWAVYVEHADSDSITYSVAANITKA